MTRSAYLFGFFAALAGGWCLAQEQPASRYVFVPTSIGALRIDSATGDVWLCGEDDGRSGCRVLAAGGQELAKALAGLEARVAALEMQVTELKAVGAGSGDRGEAIDRVGLLAERAMEGLFGKVRKLQEELGGPQL
jgi:hypothetical protein